MIGKAELVDAMAAFVKVSVADGEVLGKQEGEWAATRGALLENGVDPDALFGMARAFGEAPPHPESVDAATMGFVAGFLVCCGVKP